MTVWPSGLRRWLQAPVRKGVGSNPTAVTIYAGSLHIRDMLEVSQDGVEGQVGLKGNADMGRYSKRERDRER